MKKFLFSDTEVEISSNGEVLLSTPLSEVELLINATLISGQEVLCTKSKSDSISNYNNSKRVDLKPEGVFLQSRAKCFFKDCNNISSFEDLLRKAASWS